MVAVVMEKCIDLKYILEVELPGCADEVDRYRRKGKERSRKWLLKFRLDHYGVFPETGRTSGGRVWGRGMKSSVCACSA